MLFYNKEYAMQDVVQTITFIDSVTDIAYELALEAGHFTPKDGKQAFCFRALMENKNQEKTLLYFDHNKNCCAKELLYPNGAVGAVIEYNKQRKLHGITRHYAENGRLLKRMRYQNNINFDALAFHLDQAECETPARDSTRFVTAVDYMLSQKRL